MNVNVEKRENLSILLTTGEIDAVTCTELEDVLNDVINNGEKNIVLDFDGVVYISSAGLRVILTAIQKLHGTGKLVLSRLQEDVREIIEMAGFLNIVRIFDDLDSAAKAVLEQ